MRSTFSILFYINRSKIKTDGTTAVMCRITIDGRNTAITTGIYCNPEDWNAGSGTVRMSIRTTVSQSPASSPVHRS